MSGVKKLTQQTIKTTNRKGKKITPSTKYKRIRDATWKGFLPCGQYQLVHFRRGGVTGSSSATLGNCSSSWITAISAMDISEPSISAATTSVTWCIWLRLCVASNSVRLGCSLATADAYTRLMLVVFDILHKETFKSTMVREVIEGAISISS